MFAIARDNVKAIVAGAPIPAANETGMPLAALWECHQCHVWWGSESRHVPEARFLLQLAEPNTDLFKWEDYQGWRVKAGAAHVCPLCSAASTHPRFTLHGRSNGRAA